jgi:hypothetical protein
MPGVGERRKALRFSALRVLIRRWDYEKFII